MPEPLNQQRRTRLDRWLHAVVIILASALAAFISVESLQGIAFEASPGYMLFQFWVCLIFIAIYFWEAAIHAHPWQYMLRNLPFLFISIPYLNIIWWLDIHVDPHILYYLRYVPVIRGIWAILQVIGYVCSRRIVGLFWSYICLIALSMYFASLMFYVAENSVNPLVKTFWTSLWWSGLQLTTVGSTIPPVTATGKVLAAALSAMGMILFPLFTVYITSLVRHAYFREKTTPNPPQT